MFLVNYTPLCLLYPPPCNPFPVDNWYILTGYDYPTGVLIYIYHGIMGYPMQAHFGVFCPHRTNLLLDVDTLVPIDYWYGNPKDWPSLEIFSMIRFFNWVVFDGNLVGFTSRMDTCGPILDPPPEVNVVTWVIPYTAYYQGGIYPQGVSTDFLFFFPKSHLNYSP